MLMCSKKNESEALKKKKGLYWRQSIFELVYSSLPVFIAAGVNNFVASFIALITEGSVNHVSTEIGVLFLYTFLSYSFGKYAFSYIYSYMHSDRDMASSSSSNSKVEIMSRLDQLKLLPLLARVLNENAAFSMKEFLVVLIMEHVYVEHGFGAAFGTWLSWTTLFCLVLAASVVVGFQQLRFSLKMQKKLIEFDADAFSFSIAALLIILVASGLSVVGFTFISESSVLFSYEVEDDEIDVPSSIVKIYNVLFTFGISTVAAILLVLEDVIFRDRYALVADGEEEEEALEERNRRVRLESTVTNTQPVILAPPDSRQSMDIVSLETPRASAAPTVNVSSKTLNDNFGDISSRGPTLSPNELIFEGLFDLYHAILGCVCGVAYFTFITDNLLYLGGTSVGGHLIAALFIAVVISTSAPGCMMSRKLRAEFIELKMERKRQQQMRQRQEEMDGFVTEETKQVQPTTQSALDIEINKKACCEACSCCESQFAGFLEYYNRVILHRKRLSLVALRLTVGWTWEVVVVYFFRLVTNSTDLLGAECGIQLLVVIMILAISLGMHWYFKDGDMLYAPEPTATADNPATNTNRSDTVAATQNPMLANNTAANAGAPAPQAMTDRV